jgi:hypothetical protein
MILLLALWPPNASVSRWSTPPTAGSLLPLRRHPPRRPPLSGRNRGAACCSPTLLLGLLLLPLPLLRKQQSMSRVALLSSA